MSREDRFLAFVARSLGTPSECPLKDVNGTTIKAMVDAFESIHPVKKKVLAAGPVLDKGPMKPELQEFADAIYAEPWTVYVIRNNVAGIAYVGLAMNGFKSRYPGGRWWKAHHNDRLTQDVEAYGLMSFRVLVYVCLDETDMRRQEANLMKSNRMFTYNIKPEPDNP